MGDAGRTHRVAPAVASSVLCVVLSLEMDNGLRVCVHEALCKGWEEEHRRFTRRSNTIVMIIE